ncbi:hypothetical protein FKM82_012584 [Ascaphus truei]
MRSRSRGRGARRRLAAWEVLRGRLLPVKDGVLGEADDEDEEYERDADPQFLDAQEIDGGGVIVKSCRLRSTEDTGRLVMQALQLPLVLKYLPKLLPRYVKSLLMPDRTRARKGRHDRRNISTPITLARIEHILDSEPWKLGFGSIVYEELHFIRCEATWTNFLQCAPLLEKIPELQTHALIIYNVLKQKCMELGDTYVEIEALTSAVSGDMSVVHAWDALKFLKDSKIVVGERQRVFLPNLQRYEKDIAEYIHKLIMREPWKLDIDVDEGLGDAQCRTGREQEEKADASNTRPVEDIHADLSNDCDHMLQISDDPATTEQAPSTKLDPDQLKAAKMICSNPVTIISGKGGCGKTTVVSLVVKHLMGKEKDEVEEACKAFENDLDVSNEWKSDQMSFKESSSSLRILLTAPTGKAASLLKKKTNLSAATLHQVTCSYDHWKQKQKEAEHPTEWKFSRVEVLVVDEGSLVSVHIFSSALKLLSDYGKLAKLIILGDVRQLPSIEPGNLLADIFKCLSNVKWATELRTNHRSESQLIVDNATCISKQNFVKFDAVINICTDKEIEMPTEDKKFIFVSLPDGSDHGLHTAITTLLEKGPGLKDDKKSQFIAFRREDCKLINELCCKHYSRHTTKNHKNKFEFQCEDKVCVTRNAYIKNLITKVKDDKDNPKRLPETPDNDERLCNGEIFFITDDVEKDDKIRELTLCDVDRTYTLNYKALRRECDLRHAWARTIHTFQGSEEDTVVYVLGTAGRQDWKHVYTAVTRGRKRLYIVARKDQLDQAIANKARDRKTWLQQRLREKLAQSSNCSPQTSFPSTQFNETQVPCTSMAAGQVFDSTQVVSRKTYYEPQSSPRVPSLLDTQVNVQSLSQRDCGDCTDDIISEATIPNEHSGFDNHALLFSSSQKRQGVLAASPETPFKISRVCTSMDEKTSPLGCTSLQNLSIDSPLPNRKQLFEP